VTKIIAMPVLNSVTPKAAVEHDQTYLRTRLCKQETSLSLSMYELPQCKLPYYLESIYYKPA
jgi:hypothetical protein